MPNINNQIFKFLQLLLLFISIDSFTQENLIKYKILKGETISSIAKDNNVSITDIFKLNPTSKKILKSNSILLIPVAIAKNKSQTTNVKQEILLETMHKVCPKESLYGIARKYKTTIENLKKWNPILENASLEIGQMIYVTEIKISKLDNYKESKSNANENLENIFHEVLPKETKYSLAKKYNTTISILEQLNPEIVNNLPTGYKLIIRQKNSEKINIAILPKYTALKTDSIKIVSTSSKIKVISTAIETEIILEKDSVPPAKSITNLDLPIILEQRATDNIGTKYHSGGCKPGGFDCSGLMIYAFENSGIILPRTSVQQSRCGIKIDKSAAQKGDLIFFSTNGRGNINHVGMVVENANGELKFIHSSIHSGVIISCTSETYYKKAFKHINRVIE